MPAAEYPPGKSAGFFDHRDIQNCERQSTGILCSVAVKSW
jgi:hypothetical protein